MESDLVPLLEASAHGDLDRVAPPSFQGAAVCVVLAADGYPRDFERGKTIEGLDAASVDSNVVVFHAGTKRSGDHFVTAGGRVLGVTAAGDDVRQARDRAYAAVEKIHFDGVHYRRDIASRALTR